MAPSDRAIARAVDALRRGEVVFYPTDTLWGLAARPDDPRAIARLFAVKRRPEGTPVSLAFSSLEEVEEYADLSDGARAVMRARLPGAFTMLVRPSPLARRRLAPAILSSTGLLGVRVPDHPLARELARQAGPITSTSANLHGESPVRGVRDAQRTFGHHVAVYLEGGPSPSGRPSELLDLRGARPRPVARR